MLDTIQALSALIAPSGWEDAALEYVARRARNLGHNCWKDRLGNLIVTVKGKAKPETPVLLSAYLDEPGFMVEDITQEGLLKFGLTGNTAPRTLLGRRVRAGDKFLPGVIGLKPIHLTTQEERKTLPKVADLYIDIGMANKSETEENIEKGELGVFAEPFRVMPHGLILGKALGRSLGCAILLALMEKKLPVDVTMAFTLQHYAGSRGAYGAAAGQPEADTIVLDLTAGDSTGEQLPKLGGGPVIPSMDKKAIFDGPLTDKLRAAAKQAGIPMQPLAQSETASDGGVFQRSGQGKPAAAVFCSAKYVDAPTQMAALEDAENTVQLLLAFLEERKL